MKIAAVQKTPASIYQSNLQQNCSLNNSSVRPLLNQSVYTYEPSFNGLGKFFERVGKALDVDENDFGAAMKAAFKGEDFKPPNKNHMNIKLQKAPKRVEDMDLPEYD